MAKVSRRQPTDPGQAMTRAHDDSANNNNLPYGIHKLFTEFVTPCNVLPQFYDILSKPEYEAVDTETRNKGDSAGAGKLLTMLTERQEWFALTLEILRNSDVKLQHIADLMEAQYKNFTRSPQRHSGGNTSKVMTAASLYIDYNNRLAKDIQPIFIKCVKPENVVHVFHKYSDKVLTKVDIENVEAESNSKGPIEGAKMLFRRLVLYQDWFSVLGKVLIDPDIKSRHIADGMLEVTESTKQWYESEKAKLQTSSSSERGNDNVQPKQVTTHSIGGQVLSQVETRSTPIESSSEQYETDSAEMKSGNGVSSQLGEMATAHSRSSSQAGTSGHTVEASGKTELMSAAACGDKELLMSLLKNTSDIDASDQKGRTALMYAAGKCQTECLEQLICHRCDVNKADVDGCTALMVATDRGDDKCVELLIYERAKVDAANMSGRTALMIAATKGYAKCIKMLLLAGCDTDKRHRDGKTALMYAARQGHYDCVELLIDSHCDFDASDGTGLTALIYAALNGHFNCVHLLVDGGANVNKSDTTGNSALMWAIVCKHTECVRLLLANNADVNSVNSSGQSPLTVANSTECHELVRLIEKATRRST